MITLSKLGLAAVEVQNCVARHGCSCPDWNKLCLSNCRYWNGKLG